MGMTDAGLRGRAIDMLAKAKKQIGSLDYDGARRTLDEADDILRVLSNNKK